MTQRLWMRRARYVGANVCTRLSICLILLTAGESHADGATLIVPLEQSLLAWDYADEEMIRQSVTQFRVTCNGRATDTTDLTRRIPLSQVAPGPGVYTCTVAAVNAFGVSPDSDPLAFQAGTAPTKILNFRLEAR